MFYSKRNAIGTKLCFNLLEKSSLTNSVVISATINACDCKGHIKKTHGQKSLKLYEEKGKMFFLSSYFFQSK